MLAFGTVHEPTIALFALLMGASGLLLLKENSRCPPLWILGPALVVLAGMLLVCIPVPLSWHSALQPQLAQYSLSNLSIVSAEYQPLALRPREALLSFFFCGGLISKI